MPDIPEELSAAAWAAADGSATPAQLDLLEADPGRWRHTLELLLDDTEERLAAVRRLGGAERAQVVADFEAELDLLDAAYDRLVGADGPVDAITAEPAGEVRLQASWAEGRIVVWAAGPGTVPDSSDELADRLEAIGGPTLGWEPHAPMPGHRNYIKRRK